MRKSYVIGALAGLALPLLGAARAPRATSAFERALSDVNPHRISARIAFLADDLLEGRGTGARGSEIAARYMAAEFAEDGLEPAGDAGGYLQHFGMVGVSTDPSSKLAIDTPRGAIDLVNGENAVLSTETQKESVDVDAPLVFVGYGITAPEYHWDDFAGTDVAGKVLVCLVNDPPSSDPKFFGGKALTYYGRWTYKYEEAARRHAAGILLVHTDALAGYPWAVVRNSWSGEQAQLPLEAGETPVPVRGWITQEAARQLFADNGKDLDAMIAAAGKPGFKPVPLDSTAKGHLVFHVRTYRTDNVAGILEGSDPARRGTYVVIGAHFDHLGIGAPDKNGDRIYNGAVDNASGCSALLEIARAAADTGWRPRRSILFLGVTAEEQGLLGSLYYARHPTVPRDKIVADLNMDETSVYGQTMDFTLLGLERTTLAPIAQRVARTMGIRLDPDAHPEQGSYFRSDHFSFARYGVPALNVEPGWLIKGHDAAYGEKLFEDFNEHHYHQPSDEYNPKWDLSGTAQECRLIMRLTEAIGESPAMPAFRKGMGFSQAVRESH